MLGFPPDLEIEGLIDSDLQQICIGKYDVQFRFSSGTLISVQGEALIIKNNAQVAAWSEQESWDSLNFRVLLNCSVIGYEAPSAKLLRISFDGDLVLELVDNSDQYESMQIYPAGRLDQLIIV